MIQQMSFSELEESAKTKVTSKAKFLADMEHLVPWNALISQIDPFYPKGSRRPTIGLERMLRLYLLQQWFGLADEATEDAVVDTPILRRFVGINLAVEQVPDATTLLQFRRLLERHQLSEVVLKTVYVHLHNQGFTLRKGTIVDATIIAAPSSTKNEAGERDPEMHSTKKGEQFYFGMKAHIGVDVATGVVHSVEVTAANVADVTVVEECLHGEEEVVFADAGYTGVEKRAEHKGREVCWEIAQKRSRVREGWKAIEQKKASIRAKVEHIFGILKCRFHYVKARYKGLEKNKHQLKVLFALASLVKVRRQWMSRQETCVQN